jgi:hypothetical protein
MIPTESLAIGPAMRWLALALSSVFLFAVAVITAGDAIFRRLQRRALQRSLNKVPWHKLVVAVLLSFSLLTSQMAFGQAQKQSTPATRAAQYQKLFLLMNGLMAQVKKQCKSTACTETASEGLALIADAQEKQNNGLLSENETNRKAFHAKLEKVLLGIHTALMDNAQAKRHPNSSKFTSPFCPAKVVPVQDPVEMCALCDQTLETLSEICGLYAFVNPDAALICLAAAAIGYARCVEDWCGVDDPGPYRY